MLAQLNSLGLLSQDLGEITSSCSTIEYKKVEKLKELTQKVFHTNAQTI